MTKPGETKQKSSGRAGFAEPLSSIRLLQPPVASKSRPETQRVASASAVRYSFGTCNFIQAAQQPQFQDLLVGNAYISLNPASIHLLDAVKFSNCRGPKKYWSSPGRSAADGNKTSASCTRLAPPVRGAINSSCFVSTRKISSANTERDRLKEKKARTIHLKEGKLLLHTDWSQFVLLSTSNC